MDRPCLVDDLEIQYYNTDDGVYLRCTNCNEDINMGFFPKIHVLMSFVGKHLREKGE